MAVALAGVAAFFLWKGNKDWTFVTAVAGCVAFFLSVRFQIKNRLKKREAEAAEADEWASEITDEEREEIK